MLHAHVSSPYPNELVRTKISRMTWEWKWIVRESSSVPKNNIEMTTHASVELVSGIWHSWVGLGYAVLPVAISHTAGLLSVVTGKGYPIFLQILLVLARIMD